MKTSNNFTEKTESKKRILVSKLIYESLEKLCTEGESMEEVINKLLLLNDTSDMYTKVIDVVRNGIGKEFHVWGIGTINPVTIKTAKHLGNIKDFKYDKAEVKFKDVPLGFRNKYFDSFNEVLEMLYFNIHVYGSSDTSWLGHTIKLNNVFYHVLCVDSEVYLCSHLFDGETYLDIENKTYHISGNEYPVEFYYGVIKVFT